MGKQKEHGILWCDFTFNPWVGCTAISPACQNCYAEHMMDKRMHVVNWGNGNPRKRTTDANWKQAIKWNAEAERLGKRYRVFCASLSDVFDNEVDPSWRADLFSLIKATPNLDWLLLTKRIGNVQRMMYEVNGQIADARFPDNVWIGATICNQEEAARDIPKLVLLNAKVRFLSIEPLLGAIDLRSLTYWYDDGDCIDLNALNGNVSITSIETGTSGGTGNCVDWVIVGGESGPNARPMHPDWASSIQDQCETYGVPFFFKQWGEWEIASVQNGHYDSNMETNKAYWLDVDGTMTKPSSTGLSNNTYAMVKVGKHSAGRLLNGITHDNFPIIELGH